MISLVRWNPLSIAFDEHIDFDNLLIAHALNTWRDGFNTSTLHILTFFCLWWIEESPSLETCIEDKTM